MGKGEIACTSCTEDTKHPVLWANVIIIGDVNVGKTTLLARTLGMKKTSRALQKTYCSLSANMLISRRKTSINLKISDTGGQEKFRSLTASYYRGAHGIHDLREYSTQPDICTILVGTKSHVPQEEREVTYERAQKYAESVELPYMEVSSEEGISVTEVFEKLADVIIETLTKDKENSSDVAQHPNKVILGIEAQKQKKTFSCSC
ncbi:RABG2-like protein [Mya arenaria]|uniref:RABG2-like protein n=1 Tax=Mya arenaria TaxID=6604 RepID=A0ABY7DWW8_MYAAR|nr:RABG2-like protein [Mya arenaria]